MGRKSTFSCTLDLILGTSSSVWLYAHGYLAFGPVGVLKIAHSLWHKTAPV